MGSRNHSQARFSVLKPKTPRIRRFVGEQRTLPFTYESVGATRNLGRSMSEAVQGDYNVDSSQCLLGRGHAGFTSATNAMRRWQMFETGWVELCWPDTRICEGSAVAVLARVARGWVLNASRIVYVLEESGDIERFGFAYGTLPGHAVCGEERFLVEWDRRSDAVTFEITAMSRPNHLLSWLSYPMVRALQARFRRDAMTAMEMATRSAAA